MIKIDKELLIQRLKFWDAGVNAIPKYVWKVINDMPECKESEEE